MSVVLDKDGAAKPIMENVSLLEVIPEGIRISTLFEEPQVLKNTALKRIDFLDGVVTLEEVV